YSARRNRRRPMAANHSVTGWRQATRSGYWQIPSAPRPVQTHVPPPQHGLPSCAWQALLQALSLAHDAAAAGVGATMVVMSGNANAAPAARPSRRARARLERVAGAAGTG